MGRGAPPVRLLFDLETDGLIERPYETQRLPAEKRVTKIHCGVVYDLDTDEVRRFDPSQVEELVASLRQASFLAGHNIIEFDLPVLKELYGWEPGPEVQLLDTLKASQMIYVGRRGYSRLWPIDEAHNRKHPDFQLPRRSMGGHSLEAWGLRRRFRKDDFGKTADWKTFSRAMLDYCEQDVRLNVDVLRFLLRKTGYSQESMIVESHAARIMARQMRHGVGLDRDACIELVGRLKKERAAITESLRESFTPWHQPVKEFTPKKTIPSNAAYKSGPNRGRRRPDAGRGEDCPMTQIKLVEFNPSSRFHVAYWFKRKYGWKPKAWNDDGSAKTSEEVLKVLPYPEAELLLQWELLNDRIEKLAEGRDGGYLGVVGEDGVIHGRITCTGAKTGRSSHSKPNMAQVPQPKSPYGKEFRELFRPTGKIGHLQVGADASGLEMRNLAHFTGKQDGGQLARIVLSGDVHSAFQEGTGILLRDSQKTFTYASIYGAQDPKLGRTVLKDWQDAYRKRVTDKDPPKGRQKHWYHPRLGQTQPNVKDLGRRARAGLMNKMAGLGALMRFLQRRASEPRKRDRRLKLPDGRYVYITSSHAALNDLLQGTGAVVMKVALVICDGALQDAGCVPGVDYEFMLNVHDEWQTEVPEWGDPGNSFADRVGETMVWSFRRAGELLNFRCPLDGDYKIGTNWYQTH